MECAVCVSRGTVCCDVQYMYVYCTGTRKSGEGGQHGVGTLVTGLCKTQQSCTTNAAVYLQRILCNR
jgi:hypothetical protein